MSQRLSINNFNEFYVIENLTLTFKGQSDIDEIENMTFQKNFHRILFYQ